jgi:hypothetical protein
VQKYKTYQEERRDKEKIKIYEVLEIQKFYMEQKQTQMKFKLKE